MTTNLYILRLQGERYYIGKSNNLSKRIAEHMAGEGSAWTKKYRPISVKETFLNVSPFQEDFKTVEYMAKYGIDNVRGGSYAQVDLSEFQKDALTMQFRSAKDQCARCGRSGHFIKDCYAKTHLDGRRIEDGEDEDGEDDEDEEDEDDEDEDEDEDDEEDEWGCEYCDSTFTTSFACRVHKTSCEETFATVCYRCGRAGHSAATCYAGRDINGRQLN